MRLPEVSRPFNPVYRLVWDHMTPNERRWSFLIDMVIVLMVLLLVSGCQPADTPSSPREGVTEMREPTARALIAMQDGYDLFVDRETGCQYWVPTERSYPSAPTPRYAWGGSGLYIVGCR